jgi:ribose transport system permease protein
VLRQICANLCLSVGMTLIILSGRIDLSVGSVLALSGRRGRRVAEGTASPCRGTDVFLGGYGLGGDRRLGLIVGTAWAGLTGSSSTRFKLPPFVATLGMLSIARGLTMLWTGGLSHHAARPLVWISWGPGHWLGLPMPVWISGVIVAASTLVLKRTRFGRHVYAVGGNERAAALSGFEREPHQVGGLHRPAGRSLEWRGLLVTARLDSADAETQVSATNSILSPRWSSAGHRSMAGAERSWARYWAA